MSNYQTPGVYVEEVSALPPSVASVATAIPAFIGYTEAALAGDGTTDLTNVPTRISSLVEYETYFGGAVNETGITATVAADGTVTATAPNDPSVFIMYHQMQLYFANGGGPCYIVSVGDYSTTPTDNTAYVTGLDAVALEDEPTLLVFPDAAVALDSADLYALYDLALSQCNALQDRFAIMDVVHDTDAATSASDFRSAIGTDYLNYGAAYYPYLQTAISYNYEEIHVDVDNNGVPETLDAIEDSNNAEYHAIVSAIDALTVTLPPSAAMAGVYARVDNDRGVWKAPANVSLNYVTAPDVKISNINQETLNVDAITGKSINAIRSFFGKGILVWGARTLAGNDNEWRYIPTRRLFINVEESIKKATSWVVFEPNTANTWVKIKAQIENYLNGLWRDGALAGATPDEAFYVNVGLGITMSSDDILNGILNIEIGMAAVRPAEFIILKFYHKLQES